VKTKHSRQVYCISNIVMNIGTIERLIAISILVIVMITGAKLGVAKDKPNEDLFNEPTKIKALLKNGSLKQHQVPDPHWKKNGCIACHRSNSASRSNLRTDDDTWLCGNCHDENSKAAFIHPTGQKIPQAMWRRMPAAFRNSVQEVGGKTRSKLTCYSCHEMKMACLDSRLEEKVFNRSFFRGGPYHNRVTMCFYCHDDKLYKRFDPHKQIVRGRVDKKSCNLCHRNSKKLTSRTKLKDVRLHSSDDLSKLCINCHPWRPHPGWEFAITKTKKKAANHLVKPSKEVVKRMEFTKLKVGIELPLAQNNGEIHCATCHNPHQKGVIADKLFDVGADHRNRLRVEKACSYCHDF
jgi:predicted CXXCH cytochrome family protein